MAATPLDFIRDQEKHLCDEVIQQISTMHKTMFAIVTVAGVIVSLYFRSFEDPEARFIIVFVLAQIEIGLGIFLASVVSNLHIHAGYRQSLERKANEILGQNVCVWHSEIVPSFIWSAGGFKFWINLLMHLFFAALNIVLVWWVYKSGHPIYAVALAFELLLVFGSVSISVIDRSRVSKRSNELLGVCEDDVNLDSETNSVSMTGREQG